MRRFTIVALATSAILAGCPIPQPLPDYPAGEVTPPRILSDTTTRSDESIIPVPANCTPDPQYDLGAQIFYQDRVALEARWFVDYRRDVPSRWTIQNTIRDVLPDPDPLVLKRDVPRFTFQPYGYPPPSELGSGSDPRAAGAVHVVELVVSNGFDPSPAVPEPNRTPATVEGVGRFEIQTYRWVFVNVGGLPCP